MYRESVLKSTNVSRINKIFSYLLLVFAFFLVGMVNNKEKVDAYQLNVYKEAVELWDLSFSSSLDA